jgi:hypothetical protein
MLIYPVAKSPPFVTHLSLITVYISVNIKYNALPILQIHVEMYQQESMLVYHDNVNLIIMKYLV